MIRHDEALEQMRSANPLPGIEHVDVDELVLSRSHFEERRLAMTTSTPTPRDLSRTRPVRSWRPAIAAVSAFALVVALFGIGTVVLRGSEAPLADEPEPVATTSPSVTTIAEEPVVAAPEVAAIEPSVRVLSESPEYGTNLVLGADGLPLLLSTTRTGDEYPGTARFFRCADVACDEFTVEVVKYEPEVGEFAILGSAVTDAFVAGSTGNVYVAFESGIPASDGLPFVAREVARWSNGVVEPMPVLSNWPVNESILYTPLPSAFDGGGNPAFVTYRGSFPATINLLVCNDPLCGANTEIELDSATFHDQFPEVTIEGDTARVIYSTGEPTGPFHPEEIGMTEQESQVKIATIVSLHGSPTVSVEIIDEDPRAFLDEIDPQMRLVSAYVETVYDPEEYAAYLEEEQRIADEGLEDVGVMEPEPLGSNVVVARCLDPACNSVERTTIATGEAPWWYLDSLELEVAPDGTVLVAIAGSEESSEPGLRLFVFPDGELGPGVEPVEGHAVVEWDAR